MSIYFANALSFKHFRVMNVIAAEVAAQGDHTTMKHFTIDAENNITIHASKKAARETGAGVFANEVQLADLIGSDNKRLVEIFNSLPGVKPVTKFANRKIATERIWKAIQNLGEAQTAALAVEPVDATQPPELAAAPTIAELAIEASAQAPDVAPHEATPSDKTTRAKKAPKAAKAAKTESAGLREGSKTAQVVVMLQRTNGATISEIMQTMGWQKHTVRGFMAGAMKKAGYEVESFKPEGGERTYRIQK